MVDRSDKQFRIFRAAEAPRLEETDVMEYVGMTPVITEGLEAFEKTGDGSFTKLLFDTPGYSLIYAWFKSSFPLPLHAHNSDCLYLVIGGTLRLGTEALDRGDGFFVPAGTPYTYVPGENGVEVLEFRTANQFDIQFVAKNARAWKTFADKLEARKTAWIGEQAPVGLN